jgi:hypothetical protein
MPARWPTANRAADYPKEPYLRADAVKVWSLIQLERQLRPEAYGPRRPSGYITRRRVPAADT